MQRRKLFKKMSIAVLLLLAIVLVGCGGNDTYVEMFDEPGTWSAGSDIDVDGDVRDGMYDLLVKADNLLIWASAGEQFGDGVYEVEATAVAGPVNNGFGMVFRLDEDADNFYLFKISSDGFVWIGKLVNGGLEENRPLVQDWWFESSAVKTGLNETNVLRVRAESGNMIFFVNDQEVGRVTDNSFRSGDIGVIAETLGLGGVQVHFDNFTVSPLEETN
jgi:hypothetical protein